MAASLGGGRRKMAPPLASSAPGGSSSQTHSSSSSLFMQQMSQYIDIAFINQNPNVLERLVQFEKHEEMLRNLCVLLQHATQHQPGDPDYDEYQPIFNFDLQFNFPMGDDIPVERIQVHGMDFDEPEEYFDAKESLTEADRAVPQNEEGPIHWRDLLDLEEFEDAPDDVQEMLEVALGDQRRIPEMC